MFDDILFIPLGHEYCHISAAALCQRGGSFLAAGGSVRAHASGLLQHQSCRYVGMQLTVSSTSKQAHVSRAMIPAGTPFPDTVSQEFRTTPVFQNGNESARIRVDRMPRSPVGLRRTHACRCYRHPFRKRSIWVPLCDMRELHQAHHQPERV